VSASKLTWSTAFPLAVVLLAVCGSLSAQFDDKPTVLEWEFDVYLDDKPIGEHDFRLVHEGPGLTLETEASFDVKILFFTAYTYRHRCVETWDRRGLASIHAKTDANGEISEVSGSRVNGTFALDVNGETRDLPAELMSFAYWNPEILQEDRLLNSQTGEYEEIEVIERGESAVDYDGESIPARRYDLMVKGKPISVWYAVSDQRWLALESVARGDRKLRYVPARIPARASEIVSTFNQLDSEKP
jgi:hypothetical protein